MTNVELHNLLTEAADLLSVETDDIILTEAAGKKSEGKKLVDDVKDAIDKKDEKKLRSAIAKFKEWFLSPDPEGKHNKLRDALAVIYVLLSTISICASSCLTVTSATGLIAGKAIDGVVSLKYLLTLIASLSSFILIVKGVNAVGDEANKIQAESIDEFIKKYEKKVDELKKALENFEGDKTKKEYKALSKSYKEAVQWLDWFKGRKDNIVKTQNIKDTKQELKEAKKSKDKQKIAEAKAKYNAAKSLIESALEILADTDEEALNESVGVKDKSTDKVVKVFKTNEEATNWIINNGGNERYQLTNRLK